MVPFQSLIMHLLILSLGSSFVYRWSCCFPCHDYGLFSFNMVCLYFAVDTDFLQSNQEGYTYIGVLGYFSWSIHVFGLYRLHTILEI